MPKGKRLKTSHEQLVREQLYRMTGVDVTSIDGIGAKVALGVISEVGTDMSPWANEKKFASWLTLCPGNHRRVTVNTVGGRAHGRARTEAAYGLSRSHSALGAFFRRMRSRLGPSKAITAMAHKLARIFYRLLKNGQAYVDKGEEHYDAQYQARSLNNLHRRAAKLGMKLVPITPGG
ncbi:MAG: transposase [Planctomycetota bacterium]|nr:transposase [Planctomycetota bacterium]